MSTSLDISSLGANPAALSAFSREKEDKSAQRAEAIRLGRGAAAGGQNIETKVREVAEGFVSVFMNQVMKSMRQNVQQNPEMHGDNGEKFFQEMLDTEQSKTLAAGSGYGLTDLIYESLITSYRVRGEAGGAKDGEKNAASTGSASDATTGVDAAAQAYEAAGRVAPAGGRQVAGK